MMPTRDEAWTLLTWMVIPSLALFALRFAVERIAWPFQQVPSTYLGLAAAPIAVGLSLAVFSVNAANPGLPWPVPYCPLLAPVDIATLFALIALTRWWRAAETHVPAFTALDLSRPVLITGMGLTIFYWVNAALVRTLHAWGGIPFDFDAMFHSTVAQTTFAVFWAVSGLLGMVVGAMRQYRSVWLAGATLMVVVVLKLFVIDLANTETIARIVSFLTVGVLLLVVGYFAPVPPRRRLEEQAV